MNLCQNPPRVQGDWMVSYRTVLDEEELEILSDDVPPHLRRWDIDEPPHCQHCSRTATYALILGKSPDGPGHRTKDVCDVCLDRIYGSLDAPLTGRIFDAE